MLQALTQLGTSTAHSLGKPLPASLRCYPMEKQNERGPGVILEEGQARCMPIVAAQLPTRNQTVTRGSSQLEKSVSSLRLAI